MSPSLAVAAAATFVWLGMVTAISFVETPLKFRAPGVTLPIGLGIGRLVFRALNIAELALAGVLASAVLAAMPASHLIISTAVPAVILLLQIVLVRPRLSRRTDRVLAGHDAPRSHAHYWYVGLEVVKVLALLIAGVFLLAT
jgi:hypothetical protein